MKIFVAGATGALGKQLVPMLVAEGHEVTGLTRSDSKVESLWTLGARPVVADALDPDAVARAVAEAEPEVIVHQLTALSGSLDLRHFERDFALTNRLRTEGTDHLLAAGRAVGVRRFVAQSFAGWPFARIGGRSRPRTTRSTRPRPSAIAHDARRHPPPGGGGDRRRLDRGHRAALRRLLRPRHLVRPRAGRRAVEAIRKRKFPVVGRRRGRLVVHPHRRRRAATVAAVERGGRGIYNVVDDEPAPGAPSGCPRLAAAVGAKPPRRVPRWLGPARWRARRRPS